MKLTQKLKPLKAILFLFIFFFTHTSFSEKPAQPIINGHNADNKIKNIDLLDTSVQHRLQQQTNGQQQDGGDGGDGGDGQQCYQWECLACPSPNTEKTYPWQNTDTLIDCDEVKTPVCTLDNKNECNTDGGPSMTEQMEAF